MITFRKLVLKLSQSLQASHYVHYYSACPDTAADSADLHCIYKLLNVVPVPEGSGVRGEDRDGLPTLVQQCGAGGVSQASSSQEVKNEPGQK